MSVIISNVLNRPVVSNFTPIEFASLDPSVGVNISLDNGQAFIFRGIIASFTFTFPSEFDRTDLFRVRGYENVKAVNNAGANVSLINQIPDRNLIYRFDQPTFADPVARLTLLPPRCAEFLSAPRIYDSYAQLCFAADVRRGGSVVALSNDMQIYIEIIGEVVNKNDEDFPWKYR